MEEVGMKRSYWQSSALEKASLKHINRLFHTSTYPRRGELQKYGNFGKCHRNMMIYCMPDKQMKSGHGSSAHPAPLCPTASAHCSDHRDVFIIQRRGQTRCSALLGINGGFALVSGWHWGFILSKWFRCHQYIPSLPKSPCSKLTSSSQGECIDMTKETLKFNQTYWRPGRVFWPRLFRVSSKNQDDTPVPPYTTPIHFLGKMDAGAWHFKRKRLLPSSMKGQGREKSEGLFRIDVPSILEMHDTTKSSSFAADLYMYKRSLGGDQAYIQTGLCLSPADANQTLPCR